MRSSRNNSNGRSLWFSLILFAVAIASAPVAAQESFSGECMGTTWQVTIGGQAPSDAQELIQRELVLVDSLMSTWKDDSEISRFNASTDTEWFEVSPETATVVTKALEISADTNGAFDITVSPLIALWNFQTNENRTSIPTDEEVLAVRKSVGWKLLSVRTDPPALRKAEPNLSINLSAIAKGYAVDRVADALSKLGTKAFLVEVGGEVRAAGVSPKGKPWTVGIEEPSDDSRQVTQKIELVDQAMATSGDYRNFYIVDGKRYSHTIDPRTGRPIEHGLASVSVLAATCMEADAWATAITVLGPKDGRVAADKAGISTQLISRSPRGLVTTNIGDFKALPMSSEVAAASSMLPVFIAAGVVFLLAITGMAVGVIVSNKRLKGSCGGLAGMTNEAGQTACDLCAMPSAECRGEGAQQATATTEQN